MTWLVSPFLIFLLRFFPLSDKPSEPRQQPCPVASDERKEPKGGGRHVQLLRGPARSPAGQDGGSAGEARGGAVPLPVVGAPPTAADPLLPRSREGALRDHPVGCAAAALLSRDAVRASRPRAEDGRCRSLRPIAVGERGAIDEERHLPRRREVAASRLPKALSTPLLCFRREQPPPSLLFPKRPFADEEGGAICRRSAVYRRGNVREGNRPRQRLPVARLVRRLEGEPLPFPQKVTR